MTLWEHVTYLTTLTVLFTGLTVFPLKPVLLVFLQSGKHEAQQDELLPAPLRAATLRFL